LLYSLPLEEIFAFVFSVSKIPSRQF